MLAIGGKQTNIPIVVISISLATAQGAIATHLLHLLLRSRGWLKLPVKRLAPRLVAAVVLLACCLAELSGLDRSFLLHTPLRELIDPRSLSIRWIVQMVVMVLWMTLYVAMHELQWRRDAEGKALRLEVVAQEAQLRGLRGQLNPHFFFNCLNDLRELILENPERAQRMVTQLSGLLRYTLGASHVELVSFADEIQAVEDYLALQTIRFEERLSVSWNISVDARSKLVPPMLLQTLVENALKHGIGPRPQGGGVEITARIEARKMELEVLNTGILRDESSSGGMGLRNAHERLGLIYGGRAKLVLENTSHGRVRARVTLPLNPLEVTN